MPALPATLAIFDRTLSLLVERTPVLTLSAPRVNSAAVSVRAPLVMA